MDRFLLSENPMLPEPRKKYVLQTVAPRCLIECIPMLKEEDIAITDDSEIKEIFILNKFINPQGVPEYWKLVVDSFYDHKDTATVVSDNEVLKRYYKALERAWRWYRAYLESQSNKIATEVDGNKL